MTKSSNFTGSEITDGLSINMPKPIRWTPSVRTSARTRPLAPSIVNVAPDFLLRGCSTNRAIFRASRKRGARRSPPKALAGFCACAGRTGTLCVDSRIRCSLALALGSERLIGACADSWVCVAPGGSVRYSAEYQACENNRRSAAAKGALSTLNCNSSVIDMQRSYAPPVNSV
jgi:hypothetical protein